MSDIRGSVPDYRQVLDVGRDQSKNHSRTIRGATYITTATVSAKDYASSAFDQFQQEKLSLQAQLDALKAENEKLKSSQAIEVAEVINAENPVLITETVAVSAPIEEPVNDLLSTQPASAPQPKVTIQPSKHQGKR